MTEKKEMSVPEIGNDLVAIPDDGLIILPVRNFVGFPGTVFPLAVGRPASVTAVEQAVRGDRPIGILLQRDPNDNTPDAEGLHKIGCAAQILRYVASPDSGNHLICRGTGRFRVIEQLKTTPFPIARVIHLSDALDKRPETEARFLYLRELVVELLEILPDAPVGLAESVGQMAEPGLLADLAAAYSDFSLADRQDLLETLDIGARIEKTTKLLARQLEVLRITREIGEQTREAFDERHRKAVLREQLQTIRKELGENGNGVDQEVAELTKAISDAGMPEDIRNYALKELGRYERMPDASGEAGMLRTWLDWMVELPWQPPKEAEIDLGEARRILDADHYGLEKIKIRIIEYLAVRRLAPSGKAPILCFVGPPGVGKTSLGQSIARAMGRAFARFSLGGVHNEAEIRGHRRTYIGAMPGTVIQSIRRAGARNCVLMLDEIDKLGRGIGGDPSSALLEVLDPAQNAAFRDNYLGVDFDLSHVVFLTTANMLDTIPAPLLDRMEIISLPGYLEDEKLEIAKRHLLKSQLEATGLKPDQVTVEDDALRIIIRSYTREAGVRSLERKIGAVLRNAAVDIVEGKAKTIHVTADDLKDSLGAPRYENEVAMRTSLPGVATGLAWTSVGGDILFIEASRTPGKGTLQLTGQLGDVMRESAQAALTLIKARADSLSIDPKVFETSDIHIHVPAGATPKDGPSAGTAMFAALASLLLGRKLRSDTAMTGEISLRGQVLPVGGIREKVVAAATAGLRRILLPARNRHDFDEIPEAARTVLEFIWLETVDDVLEHGLEKEARKTSRKSA
ncbi:endopeptidase La [Pseudophaeobacter flagellatus]|uniref:endopeptidase La n=1 Tax=Pseudophaeobacter flagellatus TaxID=2899119 RepID=UPI001E300617|nr:endopeptidase La [Pseudophaeobacter flagellatus]MCD9148852.1 endopeptidase La [Pseudophaeobacter flagellatus]